MLLPGSGTAAVPETLNRFEGTARSPADGKVLYRELHFVRRSETRVVARTVFYTCNDGRPFARKDLHYVDPLIPELEITDARVKHPVSTVSGPSPVSLSMPVSTNCCCASGTRWCRDRKSPSGLSCSAAARCIH